MKPASRWWPPCLNSHMKGVHRLLREQNKIRYVLAGNEADLPGICAGAYMGGKKALMIMENSGLRQACEPICAFCIHPSYAAGHDHELLRRFW